MSRPQFSPSQSLSSDDATLAARIRAGDAEAFSAMVAEHFNAVARVAYRVLHTREAAGEVAQKTFAMLWQQRTHFAPASSVRNYLLTIARNQALGDIRRGMMEERHRTTTLLVPDVEAWGRSTRDAEGVEDRATLDVLLTRLPDRQRQAVELRYLEQQSYADIAAIMRVSPGAAEQLVIRAMETLRRHEFG